MWVQPSLGVLTFIWENEDDDARCLHPFKTEENPKKRVLETGRAAAKALATKTDLRTSAVGGNTLWTSGSWKLPCVSSVLLGFLLCIAAVTLRRPGLLHIKKEWGTFVCFSWHEDSAWLHWGIPLLSLGWVCGLTSTAETSCGHWSIPLLGHISVICFMYRFEECSCNISKAYYCFKDLWSERSFCLF